MSLTWDVLIPAYNAEETVADAVASALAQRPLPARVLVYSDGSTDRTAERARAAGAEVLQVAENRGVGAARQALLDRARSPWFVVLDADDRLLPHAGQVFSRAVEQAPTAWVLGFGATTDAGGATAGEHATHPVTLRGLWLRNPFISSSALIRRDAATAVGGFPAVRRLVDYAFWLVLARQPGARGRLWNSATPVTVRAVHGGTITGNVVGAVRAERDLLLEHSSAALAGLPAPARAALLRGRLCMLWWRGLSRHTDYGRTAASYLPPSEVVPGAVLGRLLRFLARDGVRRRVRAGAVAAGSAALRRR